MRDNNISLEEGTANLQPQLQNDSFVMEDFIMAGIEVELLSELNRCLLSLCDTCRSEISTDSGKVISLNAFKGNKNGHYTDIHSRLNLAFTSKYGKTGKQPSRLLTTCRGPSHYPSHSNLEPGILAHTPQVRCIPNIITDS